ncbi:MAG: ATPase [Eubacteriales bacterium]|nr:ATPase [Eubacteriales bacterium]MDD4389328.1 ATPase [Eubacteriales bacterium]
MEKFYLEDYLSQIHNSSGAGEENFKSLCAKIDAVFRGEWEGEKENASEVLERQKRAIIGYEKESNYFLNKINLLLREWNAKNVEFPEWYNSLAEGIFHEVWGMAGMAEWFNERYSNSSSAKMIGDNIYFLEDGKMVKRPQEMCKERREQLIRALLMLTPEERLDKDFHEIYLLDGTRITVFRNRMVKRDRECIIFRRYTVPLYTFEEQAKRGTIPREGIELFKAMVAAGYNIVFSGAVRTSKTTFLSTWQSYEDRSLEGVMIETDAEIPLHRLMPEAPIIQLIADGKKLESITKNLLRSDADYFILAEARDGVALDTAVKLASKGTGRMKITFHCREPGNFPYDAAAEIVKTYGGDIDYNARKIAGSFDYIFHFIQLQDKSKKRLKGIYEVSSDLKKPQKIEVVPICEYDITGDRWNWRKGLSKEKLEMAREENPKAHVLIKSEIEKLVRRREAEWN